MIAEHYAVASVLAPLMDKDTEPNVKAESLEGDFEMDYIDELHKKCFKANINMLASNTDLELNEKRSKIVDYLPEDMIHDFWEILTLDSSSSFRCGFIAALTPAKAIRMPHNRRE